jgi:hypothetical protein
MGVPQKATFDGDEGQTPRTDLFLIPCFHSDRAGHVGILKILTTRLLIMVLGMSWTAMEHAITVHRNNLALSRKDKCK